jgi:hypothetical protein
VIDHPPTGVTQLAWDLEFVKLTVNGLDYVPNDFNPTGYGKNICERFDQGYTTTQILAGLRRLTLTEAGSLRFIGTSVTFYCQRYIGKLVPGAPGYG